MDENKLTTTPFKTSTYILVFAAIILGEVLIIPDNGGVGLNISNNAISWIPFSILAFIGIWYSVKKNLFFYNFSNIYGALLLLWLFILVGFSEFKQSGFILISGVTYGLFFLISLQQLNLNRFILIYPIIILATLNCIYGLLQYYYPLDFDWFFTSNNNRPIGFFRQPNILASFAMIGISLSLYFYKNSTSKLINFPLFLITLIGPSTILLTFSRLGLISFIISSLLIIIYLGLTKRLKGIITLSFFTGIILGLAQLFITIENQTIPRSIETLQSFGMRELDWTHALNMFIEKPFFGWGIGGFEGSFASSFVQNSLNSGYISHISPHLTHPHNELLFWLVQGGLFATLPIVAFFSWIIYKNFTFNKIESIGRLAIITPIGIHSMLELPMYTSTAYFITFIIILFLFCEPLRVYTYKNNSIKHLNLPTFTIILISFLYFSSALHSFFIYKEMYKYGGDDLSYSSKVINPFSHDDEITLLHISSNLHYANRMQSTEQKLRAIEDALEFCKRKPHPKIYLQIIQTLHNLEDFKSAEEIFNYAKTLYTHNPFFKDRSNYEELIPNYNLIE
ncbi:PglL family O-oligosaccharyltransferase [Marinicellulosiphila megalodicopiae]|uniref:PglL family O-oligosaccharyltransferase n=1 Tax=Marinicellulosiphila megalodicopiae TaxID=2724896 RepID=UPI003BB212C8